MDSNGLFRIARVGTELRYVACWMVARGRDDDGSVATLELSVSSVCSAPTTAVLTHRERQNEHSPALACRAQLNQAGRRPQ